MPIWDNLSYIFINYVSPQGYLLLVHPSGWRSPTGNFKPVLDCLLQNNLVYLNMNTVEDGIQMFRCSTNYDYYLVQRQSYQNYTTIVDIENQQHVRDLSSWDFIPSGGFDTFSSIMGLDTSIPRVKVIHDYSLYETRKPWISKVKTDTFIYPCVYTISQSKGIQCYYSSEKKEGHFDIPKVIWSNGKSIPIVDEKGIYGMTQFSYAIEDTPENLPFIQQAYNQNPFYNL